MLALISPAKKLDFDTEHCLEKFTQPTLSKDIKELVKVTKQLSSSDLQELMKISEKLGDLNHDRFQKFSPSFTDKNSHPAVLAFKGDTYVGLDAENLSADDISYAQNHLGILSGLYGLLRPLDLMQAYRLEMGTKLKTSRGKNLYEFWGDALTNTCNEILKDHKNKTVISLASNEYIKAIQPKDLNGEFITCHFKELKNGQPKTIGLFAKRARGMMARYIIQNRIEELQALKNFKEDNYKFVSSLSDDTNFTFLREAS